MYLQPLLVLLSVGCGVMVCWRRPDLRHYARRMMPFILAGTGLAGLVLVVTYASFGGQQPR